jgi:transcriptional regulator GlxA family with amidase domain
MLSVAIPALAGAASLGTAGLMDALNKADASWAFQDPAHVTRTFAVELVGLRRGPVECRDGVRLYPTVRADEIPVPDLVIVPGLDDDLAPSFARNREWVPWITRWHAARARVASSCTGAFLLADAGLLDNRTATTHWMHARELQHRYPTITVTVDRMIVDHGDVITAGGATAFLNLVIYLLERFAGHERATFAAKVLLVDGQRPSQLPYVAAVPGRSHHDLVVHEIQQHLDAHLAEPLHIAKLASQFGLSSRTLTRRFTIATGASPQPYLQQLRIRHATRLLETTNNPIEEIRRSVGYHDPAAFRRAFKHHTGLNPSQYRNTYGPHP